MTKRIKTNAGIATRAEFESEVDTIAQLQIELKTLEAEKSAELHAVEEKFGNQIAATTTAIKDRLRLCATYADAHRPELFVKDAKSSSTALATFGFRDGQPRLALLARWTWDKVLERVHAVLPSYVRVKREVDKESLLELLKKNPDSIDWSDLGIRLVQDEPFWIAAKADEENKNTSTPRRSR